MHRNVCEWCRDWYGEYSNEDVTDPIGPDNGSLRVCRGGSLMQEAFECRSASRGSNKQNYKFVNLGFRLALVPVVE